MAYICIVGADNKNRSTPIKMRTFAKFYAPDEQTSAAPAEMAAPVLTSDKLTELNSKRKEIAAKLRTIEDFDSNEYKDASLALWSVNGEIKAEQANIIRQQKDAEMAEARNARLALNTNQLAAYLAFKNAPKNTPADKLAELETAFNTAKEAVDNELLAKYAHSTPAKKAASENGTPAKTSVNKEAILEAARAGKNHTEIQEMGYARSTVWHTINNAKKAGETFPNA